MIKLRALSVAAGGLAAALAFGGGAPAVAAKTFVHGSWPPAVAYLNRVTLPKVFKEIAEETNGEIQWKLVPGGQLAGPKESFQATQDGLIQGALGISTYVPNLVPSLNTIYSTIVFKGNVVIASGAAMETFHLECPSCIAEFKKINIVPLSGWTSSQYHLACREPVAKLDDVKGKRIRATGGYSELWRMAGAVPVAATLPEAVTLLQRGGLDCQNGVHSWLKVFGYADFAKYVTDYPVGLTGPAIGIMMNRDAWRGMTRAQKLIHLKKAAYVSAAQALGEFTIDNERYLKDVIANKGVKMVKADPTGFQKLAVEFDEEQTKRNIANARNFGVPDPAAIIASYKKNLAKWTELTKGVGRDIDKLADLIWTHVYAKVDPDSL